MLWKVVSVTIHIINLLTILYMIFKEKRSANSIVAWSLLLYVVPYVGFVIFILVGRRINSKNMYRLKDEEKRVFEKYEMKLREKVHIKYEDEDLAMIRAIENIGYCPYRNNNHIEMYCDGEEFFYSLKESLKEAKKRINIQFYIFKSDIIGMEILDILKERAEAGVEVRLLYDSVGSRSLNKKVIKDLIDVGVKTGEFFPS